MALWQIVPRGFFLSPFSEGWAGRLDIKKENDTTNGDGRGRPKDNGMKGVYHLETCMFHFWGLFKTVKKTMQCYFVFKIHLYILCLIVTFSIRTWPEPSLSLPWSVSTTENSVVANEWTGTIAIYWHLSLKSLCVWEDTGALGGS